MLQILVKIRFDSRTHSNIYDIAYLENSQQLKAVNCSRIKASP